MKDDRNDVLFRIREKSFSGQDIDNLASELTSAKGKVDINDRITSAEGKVFSYPAIYYATVSSNFTAMESLQAEGAKYLSLSADELHRLKSSLSEEVKYLLEPQDPQDLLSSEYKEIEVYVSKPLRDEIVKLPERDKEIEKRQTVLKYIDRALLQEAQLCSAMMPTKALRKPQKRVLSSLDPQNLGQANLTLPKVSKSSVKSEGNKGRSI